MLKKYVSKNEADKTSLCKNKSFPQSRGKGEREGGERERREWKGERERGGRRVRHTQRGRIE